MEFVNYLYGFLYLAVGLVVIWLAIPLKNGKVEMNGLYGARIAISYASESNWYLINAYAGRKLIRWAIVLMLAGVMAFVYPFNGDALSSILYGLIVLIIFLIPAIETISYSRTL
jgi:hypothetical protein